MLSLSPRYDLFRFELSKTFLPNEVSSKYEKLFIINPGVIKTPIDYLNESIQGITFPGISDILIQQQQHSTNSIMRTSKRSNIEPKIDITYTSSANPLDKIDKQFKITFRMNQGLYNYFMLYETIFYRICKPTKYKPDDVMILEILNDYGTIVSRVKFYDVYIDGIEGLDFNYSKLERESGTFDVTFKFNNIDFETCLDTNIEYPSLPDEVCVTYKDNQKLCEILYNNKLSNSKYIIYQREVEKINSDQIKDIFKNTDIETFDEFKYFTGVTEILPDTFKGCDQLSSIYIPSTVKKFDSECFYGCPNNLKLHFDSLESLLSIEKEDWVDEFIFIYIGDELLEEVSLDLEIIPKYTFEFCQSLKKVTFSDKLRKVENMAFAGCGFESLVLPEGTEELEPYAFYLLQNVKSIVLPSTIKSIGQNCFTGAPICSSLYCYANPAPKDVAEDAFGYSNLFGGEVLGINTKDKNKLYILNNSEGYNNNPWKSKLQNISKFKINYL